VGVALTIDGTAVGGASPLTFGANGQLTTPTAPVNFGAFTPTNGAAPLDIAFDFTAATQYGATDSITSLGQDGFASGRLTGVDISAEGIVLARYTNGQSQPLGPDRARQLREPAGPTAPRQQRLGGVLRRGRPGVRRGGRGRPSARSSQAASKARTSTSRRSSST
jgi:hypothetical protein